MKLSDMSNTDLPKRILLYGAPKTGKTLMAGQVSSKYKVHFLAIEPNAAPTLINNLTEAQKENVEIFQLPDSQENPVAIKSLPDIFKANKPFKYCLLHGKTVCVDCMKNGGQFDTINLKGLGKDDVVVVDSASQITDSVMGYVAADKEPGYKFSFNDWGEVGRLLCNFMSIAQASPFTLIVIAHEAIVTMPDGTERLVPALGSRNTSKSFARYFTDVIYCEFDNSGRFKRHSSQNSKNFSRVEGTGKDTKVYKGKAIASSATNLRMEDDDSLTLIDIIEGKSIPLEEPMQSKLTGQDKNSVAGKQLKTFGKESNSDGAAKDVL